jgi:hypothetical protein
LDRENKNFGRGYCSGIEVLNQLLEKDAMMHGDPYRHRQKSELLTAFRYDLVNWLGESKYMYGLTTIPPSRFSNTNANGLWEYSPFLCGSGLTEALELAYAMGFLIMDRIPEPLCLVHLQNMLVQKGYISQPVGLYASLQELFPEAFFADGKIPTSDFAGAFHAHVSEPGSRRATFQRRAIARAASRSAFDIHGILDTNANMFFKNKSTLRLYREANWNPERIPDSDVPIPSSLWMLRIAQTKHVFDPELVRRARCQGLTDKEMIEMTRVLHDSNPEEPIPDAFLRSLPEGYSTSRFPKPDSSKSGLSGSKLLELLKLDIVRDICGVRPLSSK